MPSVSIIVTQYFAGAAGLKLATDGHLMQGNEPVLKVSVNKGRISAQDHYDVLGLVAQQVQDRAAVSIRHAQSIDIDKLGTLALACKAADLFQAVPELDAELDKAL